MSALQRAFRASHILFHMELLRKEAHSPVPIPSLQKYRALYYFPGMRSSFSSLSRCSCYFFSWTVLPLLRSHFSLGKSIFLKDCASSSSFSKNHPQLPQLEMVFPSVPHSKHFIGPILMTAYTIQHFTWLFWILWREIAKGEVIYVKETKMEPRSHEVCLTFQPARLFLHELLNFAAVPQLYVFLTMTTRPSAFLTLKGANSFYQPASFVCTWGSANPY